jgi:4-diphosphocytidyl-2-C-methyl-D-erythritol kinase
MRIADAVRVRVPAKVNLHLGVGALRPDGFHELVTVFHAVDICDEITAFPADGLRIRHTGDGADDLPTGPDNIAWRAATLLARHADVPADVRLEIDKAIPVAGGMAGGSADGAATLLACAALWRTGTSRPDLVTLAGQLGSDVAFALTGGTALGTGRGEVLTPALTSGTFHWVFALADFGVSTARAYAELDRLRAGDAPPAPAGPPTGVLDAVRSGDAVALSRALANDLEPATLALAPQLRPTIEAGRALGTLGDVISGSGPTVAFLCVDAAHAASVAGSLNAAGVCRDARAARGPVPGARVVA